MIGDIAAGLPLYAQQEWEGSLVLDSSLYRGRHLFALRVQGDSMRGAGILDGDLVAVHRTPEVRSRQIIVARLDDEVTVKRYRQDGRMVWLLPENEEFEPIGVDLAERALVIEGVVVGVIRDGLPLH